MDACISNLTLTLLKHSEVKIISFFKKKGRGLKSTFLCQLIFPFVTRYRTCSILCLPSLHVLSTRWLTCCFDIVGVYLLLASGFCFNLLVYLVAYFDMRPQSWCVLPVKVSVRLITTSKSGTVLIGMIFFLFRVYQRCMTIFRCASTLSHHHSHWHSKEFNLWCFRCLMCLRCASPCRIDIACKGGSCLFFPTPTIF